MQHERPKLLASIAPHFLDLCLSMLRTRILIFLCIVLLDAVLALCPRASLGKPEAKMMTRRFELYYVWRSAVVAHLASQGQVGSEAGVSRGSVQLALQRPSIMR